MKNPVSQLTELAIELAGMESAPLCAYRQEHGYQLVFGEGNPEAQIMFIGEAPGRKEAETGRPFVGRAGQLLDAMLFSIGFQRQDVYITNIVKDRPPKNRNPLKEEIEFYTPFLIQQIQIIQPEIIVSLGRFALDFLLEQFHCPEQGQTIGELHGRPLHGQPLHGQPLQNNNSPISVTIFPLYHPAAVFYNRSLEAILQEDFLHLPHLLTAN